MSGENQEKTTFLSLSYEIHLQVMLDLDGLETLHNLITAVPSLSNIPTESFNTLVLLLLRRSLDQWVYHRSSPCQTLPPPHLVEFQESIHGILSARNTDPAVDSIDAFYDFYDICTGRSKGSASNSLPSNTPRTRDSLFHILEVVDATQFFTRYLLFRWCEGRSLPDYTQSGYKALEFKVFRALLNFQLFCELFHRQNNTLSGILDWEQSYCEQIRFWTRLATWEVEECKCVYYSLVSDVKKKASSLTKTGQEKDAAGETPQYTGLPCLRDFLMGKPMTEFGQGYIRQFTEKALSGFPIVDRLDLNLFLRSNTDAVADDLLINMKLDGAPKSLRIDDLGFLFRELETPRDILKTKIFLRRLGWCFWDWNTLKTEWRIVPP